MTTIDRNTIIVDGKDKTAKAFKSATDGLKRIDKQVGLLTKSLGVLGGIVAAGSIIRMGAQALQTADRLNKLAKQTGFTAEQIQRYRFAAEQGGLSTEKFNTGIQAFAKRLGELRQGTGGLFTFLNKFDKSLIQQLKTANSTDEAFRILVTRTSEISNSTDIAALSAAAFSRTVGVEMVPTLQSGIAEIDRLGDQIAGVGGVLSDELAANAERANDAINLLSQAFNGLWTTLVTLVAPAIETVAGWMTQIAKNMVDASKRVTSFDATVADLRVTIGALRGQQGIIGNLLGADDRLKEAEQLLHQITRGQLPDGVRKGKEFALALGEAGEAAGELTDDLSDPDWIAALGEASAEIERAAEITREWALAGGTVEKVWGEIGEKTGGAMGTIQTREANERLADARAELEKINDEVDKGIDLSEEFKITWDEILRDTIRGIRGAFSDMFYDIFQGEGIDSVEDFLNTIKDMFLRVIAEIAAAWLTSNIFRGIFGIGGGSIAGSIFGGGTAGVVGGATGGAAGGAAGGGLLGGLFGGASTSSGAGGGGAIIAGTTSSGAGGAAIGGAGGISGAGLLIPAAGILAGLYLGGAFGGSTNLGDYLRGQSNFGLFRGGAGGTTSDIAGGFQSFLEQRGVSDLVRSQQIPEGTAFQSLTGIGDEALLDLEKLFDQFKALKDLFPEIQASAIQAFEGMQVPAEQLTEIIGDGIVTAAERAELGLEGVGIGLRGAGDIGVDVFARLTDAVNRGEIRMNALRGVVGFTADELAILGDLGLRAMDSIVIAANEGADGFNNMRGEISSTTDSVRKLASEIRSIPSPGGRGEGGLGSFAGGVEKKFVPPEPTIRLNASEGEAISILSKSRTEDSDTKRLIRALERIVPHLERAAFS